MIQVPAGTRTTTSSLIRNDNEEMVYSTDNKKEWRSSSASSSRSRKVYAVAGVLGIVLFASIVALSVALAGIRGGGGGSGADGSSESRQPIALVEESTTQSSVEDVDSGKGNSILDIWPDIDTAQTTPEEDEQPPATAAVVEDRTDTTTPAIEEEKGDDGTTVDDFVGSAARPTAPASLTTTAPEQQTVDDATAQLVFEEVVDILINRGALFLLEEIEDVPEESSPKYRATSWISADPNYDTYSEDRIIQRWALAVFGFSWDETTEEELPPGWLSYSNECDWFTSSENKAPCDPDTGVYESINIQDQMLGGTLPPELSLLSNSLKDVVLDGNGIQGSIPKEFENLSNLESLRLRRNLFEGPIDNIDFDRLQNLEVLELGKNSISGTFPNNLLKLESLNELHLDYNSLSAEIPWDIGELMNLEKLALSNNNLTGYIPESLAELTDLEMLTLENNYLSGSLPSGVCGFDNLEFLSVDCDEQGCECCTRCGSTRVPSSQSASTLFPTPLPTGSPPSSSPTTTTTLSPTECLSEIFVEEDCYEPLADVRVSLVNCEPDSDDWVGLYLVNGRFDSESLDNPSVWSWACGTRNCREEVEENYIDLNRIHAGNGEWPLEPGIYVAVLARNSALPYKAYAVSEAFIVQETC